MGDHGEPPEFVSDVGAGLAATGGGEEIPSSLGKKASSAKPKGQAPKRAAPAAGKGKAIAASAAAPQIEAGNAAAKEGGAKAAGGKGGGRKKASSSSLGAVIRQGAGTEKMTGGLDADDLGSSSTTRLEAEEEDEADGKAMDDGEDWEWIANEPCTDPGSLCWLGIPHASPTAKQECCVHACTHPPTHPATRTLIFTHAHSFDNKSLPIVGVEMHISRRFLLLRMSAHTWVLK
jgi:hypothetical protein